MRRAHTLNHFNAPRDCNSWSNSKHRSLISSSNVTVLPALHLETMPICCKITLTEDSSILDTGVEIAVQAINLSTLQHGFMAKAFVWGWSSQPIGCIVFLVIFSRRCRSVLVTEVQLVSAEGKVPGLRVNGATGSSLCWRQTELQAKKANSSSTMCGNIIHESCTSATRQQSGCIWLNKG